MNSLLELFLSLVPILFLLFVTLIPHGLESHVSLPLASLLMYLIRLTYFSADPNLVHSAIIVGILDALTPISIVAGAIFLFETMDKTRCMQWILDQLQQLSKGRKIAEIMLIGWTFTFLVEGASGFGTPTALAAPILAHLGIEPLNAVIVCLVFNTLQTPFGSVVTDEDEKLLLGLQIQIVLLLSALIVPFFGIWLALPNWKLLWTDKIFILISILSPVLPALAVSLFSYELPTIVGGMVGLLITGICIKYKVGLYSSVDSDSATEEGKTEKIDEKKLPFTLKDAFLCTFPLWSVILILILTRVPAIGIRKLLTSREPSLSLKLGTLGEFKISAALVIQLNRVLGIPVANWTYNALFIPAWLPFVFVSVLTFIIHHKKMEKPVNVFGGVVRTVVDRMGAPSIALMGATSLVALLTTQVPGDSKLAPSQIIGVTIAEGLGRGWIAISMLMGALGSFFSGSTTVSNLTFGQVQKTTAENIGVSVLGMLTLQAVGGSLGNMICIHNILSAKVVVGLGSVPEGVFIKKILIPFAVFTVVGTVAGLIFLFR